MVKTSAPARGKKATAGLSRPPAKKNTSEANWGPSLVTKKKLKELVEEGLLPSQEEIKWCVPGDESRTEPKKGEIIVFVDHVTWGFRPPRSRFFISVLHNYKLHPQDLSANSLLIIYHFQVFCEVYLQRRPSLGLFAEFYYCKQQTEQNGGQALECGGISIQKHVNTIIPAPKLASKVKDWQRSYFYCTMKVPDGVHPFPSFRESWLVFHDGLNIFPSNEMVKKNKPLITRLKALLSHHY